MADKGLDKYGHLISDHEGRLRNLDEILEELKEFYIYFDTHSMNDHKLFLQGKKEMLCEVIEYLERV